MRTHVEKTTKIMIYFPKKNNDGCFCFLKINECLLSSFNNYHQGNSEVSPFQMGSMKKYKHLPAQTIMMTFYSFIRKFSGRLTTKIMGISKNEKVTIFFFKLSSEQICR